MIYCARRIFSISFVFKFILYLLNMLCLTIKDFINRSITEDDKIINDNSKIVLIILYFNFPIIDNLMSYN